MDNRTSEFGERGPSG